MQVHPQLQLELDESLLPRPPFTWTSSSVESATKPLTSSLFSVDAAIASLPKLRFPAFFHWKTYSIYGMLAENGDTFFCRPFGLPRHTSCWPWGFRGSGAFLFISGRLSLLPFNTSNSTPAPASCKGIFAGLTLFDLFFFFLTLLKKYQKVQFAYFALDKDGVLVYREKKSLNQEAFIVGHFGEKEKPCHGDPS